MWTDSALPPQFEAVKDKDEEILWIGRPEFLPFMISGVPFLLLGLVWGAFDYFFFIQQMLRHGPPGGMNGFPILFFLLHLFPTWGSILNMVRLALVRKNTFYAATNKRLMLRSGFFGIDFKVIDYDKISDMQVTVNPLENLLGVGTIKAFSGRMNQGTALYDKMIGIRNPYEVFKRFKEISVDVKTDWDYPNAIRPDTNPGYRTRYERK